MRPAPVVGTSGPRPTQTAPRPPDPLGPKATQGVSPPVGPETGPVGRAVVGSRNDPETCRHTPRLIGVGRDTAGPNGRPQKGVRAIRRPRDDVAAGGDRVTRPPTPLPPVGVRVAHAGRPPPSGPVARPVFAPVVAVARPATRPVAACGPASLPFDGVVAPRPARVTGVDGPEVGPRRLFLARFPDALVAHGRALAGATGVTEKRRVGRVTPRQEPRPPPPSRPFLAVVQVSVGTARHTVRPQAPRPVVDERVESSVVAGRRPPGPVSADVWVAGQAPRPGRPTPPRPSPRETRTGVLALARVPRPDIAGVPFPAPPRPAPFAGRVAGRRPVGLLRPRPPGTLDGRAVRHIRRDLTR